MISGDTIVAAATPLGFSGVAVIRVSGPKSFSLAEKVTRKKKTKNRRASLATIYNKENKKIDSAIVTLFASPASYTGEDTLEISSHGNPALVDAIISTLCFFGARLAEPGEFTYRAFLNGKIDLIQAEAVASLIKSKSIESVKEQQKIIDGQLSTDINKMRLTLINLVSSFEHQLDISEEDLNPSFETIAKRALSKLYKDIKKVSNTFVMGKMLNLGVRIVITGPPNVGKSSLLNILCGQKKAIVSAKPGTTRDVISAELILDGVPLMFFDTAGIRETVEPVEKEGVSRALEQKEKADLIISVSDKPEFLLDGQAQQLSLFVLNKADLHRNPPAKPIIHISCKNKTGISALLLEIKNKLRIKPLSSDAALLSTPRQQRAVKLCGEHVARSLALFKPSGIELEILSLELRGGIEALDVLLGKTTPEDIINNIFKSLCVGK
ncbi:MAG: tRNA uridine-5-carboxymethylaminomethyl(34) synthesis GTPase MnmE [Nitrospinaceae bacterium]